MRVVSIGITDGMFTEVTDAGASGRDEGRHRRDRDRQGQEEEVSHGRGSVASLPGAREPLIELSHVSKDYDTGGGIVHAMRDVNLTIAHGEFVAIVGTSGSGKSTMMNILGCLDRPTRGTYTLAGIDVGRRGRGTRAPSSATASSGSSSRGSTCCRAPRRSRTASCRCSTAASAAARDARGPRRALAAVGLGDRMDQQAQPASPGGSSSASPSPVRSSPILRCCSPTSRRATWTRGRASRCSPCCSG